MTRIIEKAFEKADLNVHFKYNVKPRMIKHTRINEKGCWLWTGALDNYGYGLIGIKGKLYAIHRLSAKFFLNLDLDQRVIRALHRKECNRRNCWNPDHLYIGTQQDNVRDAIELGHHRNVQNRKTT